MARKFSTVIYEDTYSGKSTEIHVTDAETEEESEPNSFQYRLPRIVFPVNDKYDEETQQELADKIVKHLNEVNKVQEEAVQHAKLMERIIL